MRIRRGQPDDLSLLLELEANCFEPERRDSKTVFQNSLRSPHQEVWLATEKRQILGSLILRFHPHTCRIYSISVSPSSRGKGVGRKLLQHAHARARERSCSRLSLEADSRNKILISWYQQNGYTITATLPHYYARNWHAIRLSLTLTNPDT